MLIEKAQIAAWYVRFGCAPSTVALMAGCQKRRLCKLVWAQGEVVRGWLLVNKRHSSIADWAKEGLRGVVAKGFSFVMWTASLGDVGVSGAMQCVLQTAMCDCKNVSCSCPLPTCLLWLWIRRLLEGIELYKENWEKIASHVGKSQSACLTHFVRLPIEDPYIDDLVNWTEVLKRNQQQQQQQLPPLPFWDEPNPLMSTLGTLSNIMGPKIAAAAAQAALQVLAEQDSKAGDILNPDVRLTAVLAAAKQGSASNGQLANGVQHGDQGAMNRVEMEDAGKQQQQQQNGVEADPHQPKDRQLMASAVAAGIAAAAMRAKQLATVEEREIQRTMVGLVHDAYRRVDAKMNLLMKLMQPEVRAGLKCGGCRFVKGGCVWWG